jgi:hypothetical protein
MFLSLVSLDAGYLPNFARCEKRVCRSSEEEFMSLHQFVLMVLGNTNTSQPETESNWPY